MNDTKLPVVVAVIVVLLVAGCDQPPVAAPPATGSGDAEPVQDGSLAIPAAVRTNLGITFASVERRSVRETLRIPGQFELRPEARREYHAVLSGRVQLLVEQYDHVEPGTPLARVDSPDWRRMQHELSEARSGVLLAEAALDVARATEEESRLAAQLLQQRVEDLAEASVRKIDLETSLANLQNQLRRLQAELRAKEVGVTSARNHQSVTLTVAGSVTQMSPVQLEEIVETEAGPMPRWQSLSELELRVEAPGIVDVLAVTSGGWVETGGDLLTTVDPRMIRFRAHALQGDMGVLEDGLDTWIVPPQGGSIALQDVIQCKLEIGFRGEPSRRTFPIFSTPARIPEWARPGISGFLEVVIGGGADEELAIPQSCVIRDGLNDVFFRRDPRDPDKVHRVEADLGASDGRWVVLASGVGEGDEIVLDGAYELKLASSATAVKGGHFHADGTFHEKKD